MMNAELEAKKLFESLSDEELIQLLQESGFEVIKGNGEVIYTESNEYVNVVSGKVTVKFNPSNPTAEKPTKMNSFPFAC
ncbi:hypothetical protein [Bacillus alveayuensis]|uniref:hypothetical protein n=1 Tax=Aeribacillus alveayuensis TaxID=279215 RepID=UPI0005CD2317|nr:hypothetical protein [Bacillus alveayuensis]